MIFGSKKHEFFPVLVGMGLSIFLILASHSAVGETSDDDGDMPKIPPQTQACYDETMTQWAKDEMLKQPNAKLMAEIDNHKYEFVEDKKMEISAEEVPATALIQKGLPPVKKWEEISEGKVFSHFRTLTMGGHDLVIADNGDVDGQIVDLYLKTKKGYNRLLRLDDEIANIHLMKLGRNSPVFILTNTSGGGSGWGGNFYFLNTDGTLTNELTIGGWQAETQYADVDGSGSFAVINSYSTGTEVNGDSLRARLRKCPGYKEFHFVGPQFAYVTVHKWNGKKFIKLGEFFHHGDGEW
jgi:hypothetical protein